MARSTLRCCCSATFKPRILKYCFGLCVVFVINHLFFGSVVSPNCQLDPNLERVFPCRLTSANESCSNVRFEDTVDFTEETVVKRLNDSCRHVKSPSKTSVRTPLAFSILVHEEIGVLETLLRLLYRPHHTFCLHVDRKAPPEFHQQVRQLIGCYERHHPRSNVFMVDHPVPVFWGHISLLHADLKCLQALRKRPGWRFALTLAGTELPMVPVEEMERRLANLTRSVVASTFDYKTRWKFMAVELVERSRTRWWHLMKAVGLMPRQQYYSISPQPSGNVKPQVPHNLTLAKGFRCMAFTKNFVDFVLDHPVSKDLLLWLDDSISPEEYFYSTLIRVTVDDKTSSVTQDVISNSSDYNQGVCIRWAFWSQDNRHACQGEYVRDVCKLSVNDLPAMKESGCFFANKFSVNVDPSAVKCVRDHVEGRW